MIAPYVLLAIKIALGIYLGALGLALIFGAILGLIIVVDMIEGRKWYV